MNEQNIRINKGTCNRKVAVHKGVIFLAVIFSCLVSLSFQNTFLFAFDPVGPEALWTKIYGGPRHDYGYSVRQTQDGGYIITGTDEKRVYLIKTDSHGDTSWTQTFGGAYNDWGYSVQQTTDGGYVICGATVSNDDPDDSGDVYLIKTDSLGNTSWTETYGGDYTDFGYSVQQTLEGGYIIAGYTSSFDVLSEFDVYLIKTDKSGIEIWSKTYGEMGDDYGYSVNQTSDGGYIITGVTTHLDLTTDLYLIKADSLGTIKWMKKYGGTDADCGYSVQQTSDGGYIIAGYTTSSPANVQDDVYLIKTDINGDSVWSRTYGGSFDDGGYSVQQTSDGGYIITGSTADIENETHSDVYLIKTDASGAVIWTSRFGGVDDDGGHSVQQTTDGGYIITGYSGSFTGGNKEIYLIKTKPVLYIVSPNGGEMWQGGETYTIEWSPENRPHNSYYFRLLFSKDGGETYADTIAQGISAENQSWEWIVPAIDANRCVVKLELLDAAGEVISEDINDRFFVIDITAPIIDSTTAWPDTLFLGPFEILSKVSDDCAGVDSVILRYRRDQDPDWIAVVMNQTGLPLWYAESIPFVSNPGDIRYYIKALDGAGNSATDPENAPADYYSFTVNYTGIAEYNDEPTRFFFGLKNNPVRGGAIFNLVIPADAIVTLRIYDVTGRLIDTPIAGRKSAGSYEIFWVLEVGSGVYFYALDSPWQNEVGKLVLMR